MSHASNEPLGRVELVVMAKAPVAGEAKTRLIPLLGDMGAARLQRWLMQRAVTTAVVADVGPVSLWGAGDIRHPDFDLCRALGDVSLYAQAQGNLGVRMLTAASNAKTSGVLIMGTDCPALTPAILRHAASALSAHDAVVVPAEDGGYVLIGMRYAAPELFTAIDWGTDRVMAQTRQRLVSLSWTWTEPLTLWDVDRPADYQRLLSTISDVGEALRS